MKHLKPFENKSIDDIIISWNSMEGEYVILQTDDNFQDKSKKLYKDFFENNIGTIVKMYYPGVWFDVEYENTPNDVKKFLDNKGQFHKSNIIYHSRNKEDCEAFLEAKKYNL